MKVDTPLYAPLSFITTGCCATVKLLNDEFNSLPLSRERRFVEEKIQQLMKWTKKILKIDWDIGDIFWSNTL